MEPTPAADRTRERDLRSRLIDGAEKFHWVHTGLGLTGNVSFFVGSVFFLWESTQLIGTWLFIVGSLGMLLGSIGDKMAQIKGDA